MPFDNPDHLKINVRRGLIRADADPQEVEEALRWSKPEDFAPQFDPESEARAVTRWAQRRDAARDEKIAKDKADAASSVLGQIRAVFTAEGFVAVHFSPEMRLRLREALLDIGHAAPSALQKVETFLKDFGLERRPGEAK